MLHFASDKLLALVAAILMAWQLLPITLFVPLSPRHAEPFYSRETRQDSVECSVTNGEESEERRKGREDGNREARRNYGRRKDLIAGKQSNWSVLKGSPSARNYAKQAPSRTQAPPTFVSVINPGFGCKKHLGCSPRDNGRNRKRPAETDRLCVRSAMRRCCCKAWQYYCLTRGP